MIQKMSATAAAFALAAGMAVGQSAAPAFEVASVKASAVAPGRGAGGRGEGFGALLMGGRGGNITPSPDGVSLRYVTLSGCIQWAYEVGEYQIAGPAWLTEDRFDIAAKAAGEVPDAQLRLMLQTLLAQRFQLKVHRESKDLRAFALVVGKGGTKMHESTAEGPANIRRERMGVTLERASTAQLATALSQVLRLPVFDQTGLTGRYDATLDVSGYIPSDPNPDLISLANAALQDLLGLKLEPRKGPIEMVEIDHVERVPTEN